MTDIATNLNTIDGSLSDIKTAIVNKGVTPSGDISTFATAIDNIPSSSPVITSLSITPSTSAQTITAPSGTDGYSPITVSAVTASIDVNITAENIKKDVTILNVIGTYEGSGGGGSTPAERTVKANYWVDTSGVVHNLVDQDGNTLSANATSVTTESFYIKYQNNQTVQKVDLSALTSVSNDNAFEQAFENCPLTKVDLSSLTTINGNYAFSSAFGGKYDNINTTLTEVDISNLQTLSNFAFQRAFTYATSLNTIKFPKTKLDISASGCFSYAFYESDIHGKLDLSWIRSVSGESAFNSAFASNSAKTSNITSVDLSSLETVTAQGFGDIFANLTNITASIIDISNLTTATGLNCLTGLLKDASGDYVFPKLSNIKGSKVFNYSFKSMSNLTSISFPALTSQSFGSYTNQFNLMLKNDSNITVHFPSNLQSVIGSWSDVTAGFGGTNTTVLFDLPATS